jgi:hypothetical protein
MNYAEKLEEWFKKERAEGRLVDVKFFPGVDPDGSVHKLLRAVYETVTGIRKSEPLDTTGL